MRGIHPPQKQPKSSSAAASSAARKLVVGLGNPGPRYKNTRHNIGALVLERILLPELGLKPKKTSHGDLAAEGIATTDEFFFLLPQTFMNLSGQAVASYAKKRSIRHENILVLSDDLDLMFGEIRFRQSGSSGGHRGLESIIGQLGTQDFPRLRLGIGRPEGRHEAKDYVLEKFSEAELTTLNETLEFAAKLVNAWLVEGAQKVHNLISRSAS